MLLSLPVELDKTLAYCTSLVTLALYICLWRGMVGVSRSAGAEKPAAPAAGAMAVLYGLLLTLAYIGLEGWLLVVPLLVIYIVLLRNMAKLSRSLADTGYVITAAPVRLPGWAVLWGSLGLLLASVLLAAFLGHSGAGRRGGGLRTGGHKVGQEHLPGSDHRQVVRRCAPQQLEI